MSTGRTSCVRMPMKNYALAKLAKIRTHFDITYRCYTYHGIQKIEHRVDITMKVGNIDLSAAMLPGDKMI